MDNKANLRYVAGVWGCDMSTANIVHVSVAKFFTSVAVTCCRLFVHLIKWCV